MADNENDAGNQPVNNNNAAMNQLATLLGSLVNPNQRLLPAPKITKAEEYPIWRDKIIRNLKRVGYDKYILEDIPEPNRESDDHTVWYNQRADVEDYLQSAITDNKVWMVLKGIGWDSTANDPKDTFDKLAQYFEKGAADTNAKMLKEFANIRRNSFDKMPAFQLRVNFLRERLNTTEFKMSDKGYIWLVVKGIQEEYPELYGRMVSGIEAGIVTWVSLMAELQQLAVTEEGHPSMSSIKVSTKEKDNKSKGNKNTNNDNEKVKCKDCDFKIHKGFKHCKACGNHIKTEPCWWCSPELAPSNWKNKKLAIEKKKERATSTTAPLHQQSGVANPTNIKPSNIFFTTNHGDDEDGGAALVNLPVFHMGFHQGPQRQ
jgi:hypothetical protein